MLVGIGATANYCAFYLTSPTTVEAHKDEPKGYDTSKGASAFKRTSPYLSPSCGSW